MKTCLRLFFLSLDKNEHFYYQRSRERPKSVLYLRLKIVKGGPFELCETPVGCKIWKKIKGLLGDFEKLPKKLRFLDGVTVPKKVKGAPFGTFWHCVAKYRNKRRGNTLVESKKLLKKLHSAEKKPQWKHQRGILCFRSSGRRCFCFGRGSGASSMLWTSVVHVDDDEQINKKVDRSRWTDETITSHCKSRAFLRKHRLKNWTL